MAIVVPARDEQGSLPMLLASLASQDRMADEVIVVDDGSRDATAAVAGEWGAKVVAAGPLPGGWTGKAWACAVGAETASAGTLVFLDADIELAPDALSRLLAEHGARGARGLLSVAPEPVVVRPYERLSAMCNLVAMMGTGAFTPLGSWGSTMGAFGPCLVCERADYEAVGGHASVAGAVVEDVALAACFREAGLTVRLLGGKGIVRWRMYPDGLGQLVEGWTKNLATGAGATSPLILGLVVAWLSGLLAAPWAVVRGLTRRGRGSRLALGRYAAYALQVEWMLGRIGRLGRGTGLAYPMPLAAFLALLARSAVLTAGRHRVRWKGRDLAVGPRGAGGVPGRACDHPRSN